MQEILQEKSKRLKYLRNQSFLELDYSLRAKCPNTELFLARMWENTNQK